MANLEKLVVQVKGKLEEGIRASAERLRDFLDKKLKEAVGVPAPTIRGKDGKRIITPATAGAPPRKISGKGQEGVRVRLVTPKEAGGSGKTKVVTPATIAITNVAQRKNFRYMMHWETHGHPWIKPTLDKLKKEIRAILGKGLRLER